EDSALLRSGKSTSEIVEVREAGRGAERSHRFCCNEMTNLESARPKLGVFPLCAAGLCVRLDEHSDCTRSERVTTTNPIDATYTFRWSRCLSVHTNSGSAVLSTRQKPGRVLCVLIQP